MTAKQTNPQKPKARNGKPLMSELLTETRKYLELAEQADVASLRQFLFNEPERPLIAMGHGGSHSSAAYAALLYGTNCGLGRTITPYQANSLSDATLKSAKQLLIKMSVFTSTFGEKYRHSNPNDPNNLGGFDKRLFRNNVRFQKDFRQYGSLSL